MGSIVELRVEVEVVDDCSASIIKVEVKLATKIPPEL